MAKPLTKNLKKSHRAESLEAMELRLQLAQRDRQLAELTEHSLRILDELAMARQQPVLDAALQQRVVSLEGALADARQRMRTGSRALLTPSPRAVGEVATFDVVLWGYAADPEQQVTRATTEIACATATVLMGRQHRAESFVEAARAGWTVLESSCARPAHYWNQAMSATTCDVVVFLIAGASIHAEDLRKLAEAARCSGVAVSSPRLSCGGEVTLGRGEQGILDVRPMQFSAEVASALRPFASPEAFALSRAAFEAVGPFDQDLASEIALAEWTMRAASQSLRIIGVVDAQARVDAMLASESAAVAEADRLTVLARHRPHQLMVAALASEALWQADADFVGSTLRAAMQRLPRAQEFPAAIEILVHQAQTVSSYKRIAPAMRDRIAALCRELQLATDSLSTDGAWPSLVERAVAAIGPLRQQASLAATARLEADRAKSEQVAASARFDAAERELKDGMLARSGTIDALRNELLERERAIASLRQDLGHGRGEAQRCIDHLAEQQQLILDLQEQAGRDALDRERRADIESKWAVANSLVQKLQADLAETTRAASQLSLQQAERARVEVTEVRERSAAEIRELRERSAAELGALRERSTAEVSELRERFVVEIEELRRQSTAEIEELRAHGVELETRSEHLLAQLGERESAAQEAGRRAAQLLAVADRRADAAQERAAAAEAVSQAAATRAMGLEARIRAADSRVFELEDAIEEAKAAVAQQGTLMAARSERQEDALRQVEARNTEAKADVKRLEGELEERGAKNAELGRKQAQAAASLEELRQQLATVQQQLRETDTKRSAAVARSDATLRVIEERETWIALLLDEVRQRRWAPRDLLQHECDFLARRDERKTP